MRAIFVTYIYQPFFNILVGLYWLVGQTFGSPDMGIAVIPCPSSYKCLLDGNYPDTGGKCQK